MFIKDVPADEIIDEFEERNEFEENIENMQTEQAEE